MWHSSLVAGDVNEGNGHPTASPVELREASCGACDSRAALSRWRPYDPEVGRWGASAIYLAVGGLVVVLVDGNCWAKAAPSTNPAASTAQALRTCVDRWNQDNMVSWGSMSVRISIRGLDARERSVLSIPNPAQLLCTLSLAGRPGDNSWICRIGTAGGYECPLVTSDGMPPLRKANGTTDDRGVLKLDMPLKGTHATPPLAWQRRYPHVDGFIMPWTRAGKLRSGLRFIVTQRGRCGFWVEHRVPRSGGRCVTSAGAITEPCFPQRRNFRAGDLAACGAPGDTRFIRWVITGRL
jgi:hypothetical protein